MMWFMVCFHLSRSTALKSLSKYEMARAVNTKRMSLSDSWGTGAKLGRGGEGEEGDGAW